MPSPSGSTRRLAGRVPFLHGAGHPGAPALSEFIKQVRDDYGLNVAPGHGDDGWADPPPVELGDGTVIQLYKDGSAALAAYEAIEAAKRRVLLEMYIWSDDETGRKFTDLLARQARAGVSVFVIYDGLGTLLAGNEMFDQMKDAGVYLVEFHPVRPSRAHYRWRPLNRDHRKLLVIDDEIAGVAGLNIGNDYAGTWVASDAHIGPDEMWRDAGIGIRGPAAMMFARAFRATWQYCTRRGPIRRALYVEGLDIPRHKSHRLGKLRVQKSLQGTDVPPLESIFNDGVDIACMASAPTLASPLRPMLHRLLSGAKREISLTMAYFAPDDGLIAALCNAGRRGVKVRLILAGRTDVQLVKIAGRAFYHPLMCAGCEVYEREGAMLHQKSIVIDRKLSVIGSTNLDYRSIEFNLELSAIVRSEAFADQLTTMLEHDIRYAERIDKERWRNRPYRDQFVQWLVSRARYLL